MFTTEPGLAQAIERLIDATPIVDPHTHIHCDRPSAPDLAALLSYHWVQTELIAVGMPPADLDPALPVDERVRRMIPYLGRMRNTAMSWCLYRILWDLYDFPDPHLTESNYRDLLDRVAARAADPDWPRVVLRDRCKIRNFVTSLGNRGEASSRVADRRPVHARRPLPLLPRRRDRPRPLLHRPDDQARLLRGPLPGPRRPARHRPSGSASSSSTGSNGP